MDLGIKIKKNNFKIIIKQFNNFYKKIAVKLNDIV